MPPPPPARIGPYAIERELARGGMGAVYRGRAPDGSLVAIKLLLAGRRATPAQRKRFRREATAMRQLDHPGVVAVRDAGEHEGAPYLVLDYVEGQSLEARLAHQGPLPLHEAVELARQLALAIQHAHERGILHRDLKPGNVLLDAQRRCRLTDFGLANALDPSLSQSRLSRTGEYLGTPGYWPPEQARGELDRIGPRSDVYGVGAVLYAALTATLPQPGEDLIEKIEALERGVVPPSALRPGVDGQLDAICLRCLEPDPDARFATAQELAARLETYQDPTTHRPVRSRRPAALALIGIGAAAAGAVLWGGRARLPATPDASASAVSTATAADPTPAAAAAPLNAALELIRRGSTAEAEQDLSALIARGERVLSARFQRGLIRYARQDYGRALEDFDRALQLQVRDEDLPQLHMRRGMSLLLLGRDVEALADFEAALAGDPDWAEALMFRARALFRMDRRPEALTSADRALELEPDDAGFWLARAQLHHLNADPARARADLRQAMTLDPSVDTRRRAEQALRRIDGPPPAQPGTASRGQDAVLAGDFAAAAAAWEALAAERPRDRAVGILLEQARAIAAGRASPTQAQALQRYVRGVRSYEAGDVPAAREHFEESCRLNPSSVPAWIAASTARAQQGEEASAFEAADRAVALAANGAHAYFNRGELHRRFGRLDDALADFERAIAGDGVQAEHHDSRGRLYHERGQLQQALNDSDQGLTLSPDPKTARSLRRRRGQVLLELGRPADALAEFDRILAATTTRPASERAVGLVDRVGPLLILGQREAMFASLDAAIELDPDTARLLYQRGQERLKTGDFARAIADVEASLARDPDAPWRASAELVLRAARDPSPSMRWLGPAYMAALTGDVTAAAAGWERYLEHARSPGERERVAAVLAQARALLAGQAAPDARRALTLFVRGQVTKAELPRAAQRYLAQAIELTPTWAAPWIELAKVHLDRGALDQALAALGEAIRLAPELHDPWCVRAGLRVDQGQAAAAESDYDRALEADPSHARDFLYRGRLRKDRGAHPAALEDYERGLSGDCSANLERELRLDRARVLSELGRHEDALAEYDRVVSDSPQEQAEVLNARAITLARLNRLAEALASLDDALIAQPDHPLALSNRGALRLSAGDAAGAAVDLERCLELDLPPVTREAAENNLRRARAGLPGDPADEAR